MSSPPVYPPPDEVVDLGDGRWQMWAIPEDDGAFWAPGHRRFAQAHDDHVAAVPVLVAVAQDGDYWGWRPSPGDEPCMIYPHESLLDICWPGGYRSQERRSAGRAVRLTVTAA